jgi:hypothetical protein
MGTVHELPRLAVAEVRVMNSLNSLHTSEERSAVLAWAVARTLSSFPDPERARAAFLSDMQIKMAALAGQPIPRTSE